MAAAARMSRSAQTGFSATAAGRGFVELKGVAPDMRVSGVERGDRSGRSCGCRRSGLVRGPRQGGSLRWHDVEQVVEEGNVYKHQNPEGKHADHQVDDKVLLPVELFWRLRGRDMLEGDL